MSDAADAHIRNLRKGEAEAVKNDAQTQQMLFGQQYAAVAGFPDMRVQGVTHDHAEQDGQRQRAESRACDGHG